MWFLFFPLELYFGQRYDALQILVGRWCTSINRGHWNNNNSDEVDDSSACQKNPRAHTNPFYWDFAKGSPARCRFWFLPFLPFFRIFLVFLVFLSIFLLSVLLPFVPFQKTGKTVRETLVAKPQYQNEELYGHKFEGKELNWAIAIWRVLREPNEVQNWISLFSRGKQQFRRKRDWYEPFLTAMAQVLPSPNKGRCYRKNAKIPGALKIGASISGPRITGEAGEEGGRRALKEKGGRRGGEDEGDSGEN